MPQGVSMSLVARVIGWIEFVPTRRSGQATTERAAIDGAGRSPRGGHPCFAQVSGTSVDWQYASMAIPTP